MQQPVWCNPRNGSLLRHCNPFRSIDDLEWCYRNLEGDGRGGKLCKDSHLAKTGCGMVTMKRRS